MRVFNMKALFAAMDERRALGLSWDELAKQVNLPFRHFDVDSDQSGDIEKHSNKRSTTSAVVLQVLRWFGRAPGDFSMGGDGGSVASGTLPRSGDRILRFDTRAMYDALDERRSSRALTWKRVAAELPGFTPARLTHLAEGPLIGFPHVMFIAQWLGRPAADFVRECPY